MFFFLPRVVGNKRRVNLRFISLGLLITLVILFWASTLSAEHAFDDAYITYRYADNLRNGLGLVYNPGEWVLGTTTPLFAMLLGALGLIFANIELLGHWLGILSWIVAAWAAMALFWQAERPLSGTIAGLLVALQPSIIISLGMETTLVVALMLSSAWAWLGGRKHLAVILLAFLILTRQDGALWALFLGLEVWRRERSLPWREGVATMLLTAPWFVYAQSRYGSILPNSALAKIGQNQLMAVGSSPSFLTTYVDMLISDGLLASALLFLLTILLGIIVIFALERRFWWLVGWTVAYLAIYHSLQVVSFTWYFVPPIITTQLLIALGIGQLLKYLKGDSYKQWLSKKSASPSFLKVLGGIGMILLVVLLLNQWQQMQDTSQRRAGYRSEYRDVGLWLAQNTAPTATIASIEIGVIGYFSERPILDTMGLVSPEMTEHLVGWTETLVYATNSLQPDYAVVLQDTGWDWLVKQWWFNKTYKPVIAFNRAVIYQRTEPPDGFYEVQIQATYESGIHLESLRFDSQQIEPVEPLDVQISLKVLVDHSTDYQLTAFLIDPQTYERVAVTTVEPFYGGYPSRFWREGDNLTIPIRLTIPAEMMAGSYQVGLVLYDTVQKHEVTLRDAPDVAAIHVGWVRLGKPALSEPPESVERLPLETEWQEGISLSSLAILSSPLIPKETTPVLLSWQVRKVPSRNLTIFLHLLNQDGQIVAQQDQLPFAGRFPTTVWQPGEILEESYYLTLPPNLSEGTYGLRLGFYDEIGRLPLANGSGDSLLLPDLIRIEEP